MSELDLDEQEFAPVHVVQLQLCDPCIDGEGDECHTPGCSLWLNRPPDIGLRDNPSVTITTPAEPQPAPELTAAMGEARLVREAVSELLGMFRAVSGGWAARTSSSRLRKIAERVAVPWDEYKREAPDTDEAAETRKVNEELTTLHQRIDAIAEGLEHRAEINRPSKVSEICDNIAGSLRRALEGKRTHRPGVCQCTPCKTAATIETAGTEHIATQITESRQA